MADSKTMAEKKILMILYYLDRDKIVLEEKASNILMDDLVGHLYGTAFKITN